mmetsp:Transcript_4419/g.18754  ORF Transcript_4419/g.18754 Transcript_4419/m.18754 type:complete len:308 (-) Transcript_4419:1496-2419(-)
MRRAAQRGMRSRQRQRRQRTRCLALRSADGGCAKCLCRQFCPALHPLPVACLRPLSAGLHRPLRPQARRSGERLLPLLRPSAVAAAAAAAAAAGRGQAGQSRGHHAGIPRASAQRGTPRPSPPRPTSQRPRTQWGSASRSHWCRWSIASLRDRRLLLRWPPSGPRSRVPRPSIAPHPLRQRPSMAVLVRAMAVRGAHRRQRWSLAGPVSWPGLGAAVSRATEPRRRRQSRGAAGQSSTLTVAGPSARPIVSPPSMPVVTPCAAMRSSGRTGEPVPAFRRCSSPTKPPTERGRRGGGGGPSRTRLTSW